jgi:hypothetical protein
VLTLFYNLTRQEQKNKNDSKQSNQQMDQGAIKKIIPPPPFPSKSNRSMSRLPTSGGQRSIPKPASRIILNRAASATQSDAPKANRHALKEKQSERKADENKNISNLKPPSGISRAIPPPGEIQINIIKIFN